jgi:hypothetical protein
MEIVAKSWGNAATLCFQKNGYPIGYEDVRNVTTKGVYAWTGIVWSDVIYKYTGIKCVLIFILSIYYRSTDEIAICTTNLT